MEIDKPLEINETVNSTFEIKYKPASFFRRVMANLFDFILFIGFLFAIFLGLRGITTSTTKYKDLVTLYENEQINSSLYVKSVEGPIISITEYIDGEADLTHSGKHNRSKNSAISFYSFLASQVNPDDVNLINECYLNLLDYSYSLEGETIPLINTVTFGDNYIVIEESDNEDLTDLIFYETVYKPFINNKLIELFSNMDETYKNSVTTIGNTLLYVDFPISFLLAGLLIYFLPPLIFKRGRMTIGKMMYKIGLVNEQCFNVSFKVYLLRFVLFFFGELVLSFFTLAVPILISFSLMAFSKKNQGFPDYMLKLREVDATSNKIYYDHNDILLTGIDAHKEPVNFQLERPL